MLISNWSLVQGPQSVLISKGILPNLIYHTTYVEERRNHESVISSEFSYLHKIVVETFFCEYLFAKSRCLSNPLTSFRSTCNTNSREKWVFYFKSLRKEWVYNKRCRTLALTIFVKLEGLSISFIATTMRKGKDIIQIASYLWGFPILIEAIKTNQRQVVLSKN